MGVCSSAEGAEGEAEDPSKKEIIRKSRAAAPSPSELLARLKMPSCPNEDLVAKWVEKGDLNAVDTFVQAWPSAAYEYALTLVDVAANERKYKIWQLLIDEGICEVNWKRSSGYSPLMEAILADDVQMVEFLLNAGADVNELYLDNWTTLLLAVKERVPSIVKALLQHNLGEEVIKNINDRSYPDGWTALLLAANLDEKEAVKCEMIDSLLRAGADPNLFYYGVVDDEAETDEETESLGEGSDAKGDKGGLTALHIAAMKGEKNVCELLVKAGADVTLVGKDNNTCLHYACIGGDVEVAKVLLGACKATKLDDFINMKSNRDGWTGLHFCAKLGHSQIGLELMNCDADTTVKSIKNQMSPYALAKASKSNLLLHIIAPTMEDLELQRQGGGKMIEFDSPVPAPTPALVKTSTKAPPRASAKGQPSASASTDNSSPVKAHTKALIEPEVPAEAPALAPAPAPFQVAAQTPTPTDAPVLPEKEPGGNDEEEPQELSIEKESVEEESPKSPMDKVGPQMKRGFMMKQGDWLKDEKQRWFVLDRGRLCYYLKEAANPPYGEDKKGEMIIDESVGIYTLEKPPMQGDRDSRTSDGRSTFIAMRDTLKASASIRNSVSSRVCKNDRQILIVRKVNGNEDADLLVCLSKEERDEWVSALEEHKYSNSL